MGCKVFISPEQRQKLLDAALELGFYFEDIKQHENPEHAPGVTIQFRQYLDEETGEPWTADDFSLPNA